MKKSYQMILSRRHSINTLFFQNKMNILWIKWISVNQGLRIIYECKRVQNFLHSLFFNLSFPPFSFPISCLHPLLSFLFFPSLPFLSCSSLPPFLSNSCTKCKRSKRIYGEKCFFHIPVTQQPVSPPQKKPVLPGSLWDFLCTFVNKKNSFKYNITELEEKRLGKS